MRWNGKGAHFKISTVPKMYQVFPSLNWMFYGNIMNYFLPENWKLQEGVKGMALMGG